MAPLPRPANHPCAPRPNPLSLSLKLPRLLPLEVAKDCDPLRSPLLPQPQLSTPERRPPSSPCRAAPQPAAAQAPMPRKRQPKPPPCGLPHCAVAPDRQATARVQRSTPPGAHLPPRTRPASPASAAQPENTGPSPHFFSLPEQHFDHPSPQSLEPQQQDSPGRSPPQSAPQSAACRWFAMGLSSAASPRRPRGPLSTRRPPRAASATEEVVAQGWRIHSAEPAQAQLRR